MASSNSSPLVSSKVHLPNQTLWFGRAELYDTHLQISGWHWRGRYARRVDLSDLERVETRPRSGDVNALLHTSDGTHPLHLETGLMLWHWKLKDLGVKVVGQS